MTKARVTNLVSQADMRRKLRHTATPEEVAFWSLVKSKQICGVQFRRQFSVGPYVLDFYCPRVKLCVELDGIHHYSEEEVIHDKRRTDFLATLGIEVIRIDNTAIWTCSDMVVSTIKDVVQRRLQSQHNIVTNLD